MALYCWGNTAHGELGLGGIEEEQILVPRELNWTEASDVDDISCGLMHTLLLTTKGRVFSCGNNDHGQLGQELSRKRPQPVTNLENYVINQVSCGATHSLAINEWGQLFSWGSNSRGQLAKDTTEQISSSPKLVKALATKHIVQIASGQYHSLALTNSGDLYSWGSNAYGQLGLGNVTEMNSTPTLIKSLTGIPIAFITCGGNHSFAVTKSGAVYGWGKNLFGQLGLSDEVSRHFPTQLKTMRSLGVRFISCGDDFSVFLTSDGGVFSSGLGTYGQLGHGNNNNNLLPRMVVELMGTSCTQISCGRWHTLTFVPSRGRVYGFGLGASGQLGNRTSNNATVPQVVVGPWLSPSGVSLIDFDDNTSNEMIVRKIFSGGDHSFVSTVQHRRNLPPVDYRVHKKKAEILSFSVDIAETCVAFAKEDTADLELMIVLETLFKSLACINASFLNKQAGNASCTSKYSGVDISQAEIAFGSIQKMENEALKQIIWDSITNDLLGTLIASPPDVETLRVYLILPLYHEFINSKNYSVLHCPFGRAILRLQDNAKKVITKWWARQSKEYFERLVEVFKGVATHIIHFKLKTGADQKQYISYEPTLEMSLKVLLILFRINHQQRFAKVPYDIFHLPEIMEVANLQQDYIFWLMDKNPHQFYLCDYPFIFDAKAKTLLLQTDQAIQMQSAIHTATARTFMSFLGGMEPMVPEFVVLNVSRENLVEDTLREIMQYGTSDLKRPLKVKFTGEEAEDAGGVRKEFFMLLLKDLLDPKYGMFKEFEDSRAIWFAEHSFESTVMFMLIGCMCGLAIYNFTIINLPFPLALYKKLLKEDVDITDLRDLSPTLANSMQSILDYDADDLQEVFDLNFAVTREVFGETQTILLKEGGDKILVTQANKVEFVDLYIDYVLNKSVLKQFQGFSDGFMKVCGGKVMELFRPHELMAVVVGNENYDWHVLESEAQYKNGYTSGDQTIRWFWEVFHELSLAEKKKFLLYLTGSDRIPIQGMKAIKIYVQPVNDDKHLPVAHTCFNLLDLPRYKTKERLKYKLTQAIQQTLGFSLV